MVENSEILADDPFPLDAPLLERYGRLMKEVRGVN